MLVLALDTATPAITAGVIRVTSAGDAIGAAAGSTGHVPLESLTESLAEGVLCDRFGHAEKLMPLVTRVLGDATLTLRDLDVIVVGAGPGPFTGLRVGIATAQALGDALDLPVHPVPSHDGLASALVPVPGPFLVVTDARRREVYLSGYDAVGRRQTGPAVLRPDAVPAELVARGFPGNGPRQSSGSAPEPVFLAGPGAPILSGVLAGEQLVPRRGLAHGLVLRALLSEMDRGVPRTGVRAPLTSAVPGPITPLYLRRPDATEPAPRSAPVSGRRS